MKNRKIENKKVGKIFRTLGFVMLLIFMFYFALLLIAVGAPDIAEKLNFIGEIYQKTIVAWLETNLWLFILIPMVGLAFVFVTQVKTIFMKVLLPILVAVMFLITVNNDVFAYTGNIILAFPILNTPEFLTSGFINDFLVFDETILGVIYIVFGIITLIVFAYRKPIKITWIVLRVASLLFVIAAIMGLLPTFIESLGNSDTFNNIHLWVFAGGYTLFSVSSLTGIIGLARK